MAARRLLSALALALAGAALAAVLLAAAFSRLYWGYWFARPAVPREVAGLASVAAVIPVETRTETNGERRLAAVAGCDLRAVVTAARGEEDTYYCLTQRLLLALDDRTLLPAEATPDLSALPPLFPLLRASGLLVDPEEGYATSDQLGGVVVDAVARDGRRCVLLGLTGGQQSNDHYPYYEFVFSSHEGGGLAFDRGQVFFYDVAGIEGAEWPIVARLLLFPCAVIALLAALFWWARGRAAPPA